MAKENYYTFIQMPPGHSKSVQQDMLFIKKSLRSMLHHRKIMNMIFRTSADHYYTKLKQNSDLKYTITSSSQL